MCVCVRACVCVRTYVYSDVDTRNSGVLTQNVYMRGLMRRSSSKSYKLPNDDGKWWTGEHTNARTCVYLRTAFKTIWPCNCFSTAVLSCGNKNTQVCLMNLAQPGLSGKCARCRTTLVKAFVCNGASTVPFTHRSISIHLRRITHPVKVSIRQILNNNI